uniref:Glycosyltransferase 61 catalytic domain-containing protein n=1 Tax=Kalanchoe fedtschenkoi TaxID=63787 RepID=A0A7N0TWH2_KALFE
MQQPDTMTRSSVQQPPKSPSTKLDASSMSISITRTHSSKNRPTSPTKPTSLFSPKLSIYILCVCVSLFIIFQIQSLQTIDPSPSPASTDHRRIPTPSWNLNLVAQFNNYLHNSTSQITSLTDKLRKSVTFLPLKDLRFSSTPLEGHTWFMSSLTDKQEPGEVQHQHFPSPDSQNRLLCLKGHDTHDGANNYYALAYPEALPANATLLKGLTFVSYNHYNYDNIWHGLSAMVPFVAWHKRSQCQTTPARWVLFHWGEIRGRMGPWVRTLMEATFDGEVKVETFEEFKEDEVVCFEEAVVMRHNEGGMSRERRVEVYDLMRCKARVYCNLSMSGAEEEEHEAGNAAKGGLGNLKIGMTVFMRSGARGFKNESAVVEVFQKECDKVDGCRFQAAHSNNLTFCEQVKLMGETDVLISPHGAQLTNMFLMNRNSSVMEFFPKGWLKLAGVGQFVYHWIASWSGMRHKGAWRDPEGAQCPYPEDDKRCMSFFKGGMIGYNRTYFADWGRAVLDEVRAQKTDQALHGGGESFQDGCPC